MPQTRLTTGEERKSEQSEQASNGGKSEKWLDYTYVCIFIYILYTYTIVFMKYVFSL